MESPVVFAKREIIRPNTGLGNSPQLWKIGERKFLPAHQDDFGILLGLGVIQGSQEIFQSRCGFVDTLVLFKCLTF